jgi:hypothetical protein
MNLNPDDGRQFAATLGYPVTHNTLQAVACSFLNMYQFVNITVSRFSGISGPFCAAI